MNKLKLIYDVVMTMKKKESINGSLQVEGKKDQVEFLRIENAFEKNLISGELKAKITTDIEAHGNTVKHQSTTELNLKNCDHGACPGKRHGHHGSMKCGGLKSKLGMLAFGIKLIDNMQIVEQEDEKLLLSINLDEFPEVLKSIHSGHGQEMSDAHHAHDLHHVHHAHLKELSTMEKVNIGVTILINKDKEIEKIQLIVAGKQNADDNSIHELNFQGEVQLNW